MHNGNSPGGSKRIQFWKESYLPSTKGGKKKENKPMGADVHVELLKMYLRLVNSPVPPVVEHVVFGCKACLKGN